MNSFANSLLTLLLGWMRAVFSGFLLLLQGTNGGFIAWLSRRWLVLALLLILFGLLVDAFVYVARWRPQYVWRFRLYRLLHRREYQQEEAEFDQGFDSALPNFDFSDTPIQALQAQEPIPEEYMAPVQPIQAVQPAEEDTAVLRNRRSSRHARRAIRTNIRFRLPDLSDSDRYSTAYPEPPVQAREAFHAPVYPSMSTEAQEPTQSHE